MRCKLIGTGNIVLRPEMQQATMTRVLYLLWSFCVCNSVRICNYVIKRTLMGNESQIFSICIYKSV